MAVSTLTNRVTQQGNGSSAVFQYPYYFFATSDLTVYTYNPATGSSLIKALGVDYSVSGTPTNDGVYRNGGSVTFNSSPNNTDIIIIFNNAPLDCDFTQPQFGTISSKALTQQLDYVTLLTQRLDDRVDRSCVLPDGAFQSSFVTSLPMNLTHASSAGKVFVVNSSVTGFEMGPSAADISGAAGSAASAAASAASASASSSSAGSSALSASNSAFNANSAAVSVNAAAALIGSTAFWGLTAQSSALSATNQAILANSSAMAANSSALFAFLYSVNADGSRILAASSAVSATNQAILAGSAALSASNSVAGLSTQVTTVTAAYTQVAADSKIIANSSNYTITLVSVPTGNEVSIFRGGTTQNSSVITVQGSGVITIAGVSSIQMPGVGDYMTVFFDGSNYRLKADRITSRAQLQTAGQFGTLDTRVRAFSTVGFNEGNCHTIVAGSGTTTGAVFTALVPGRYAVSFTDSSTGDIMGLVLNGSGLTTTGIASIVPNRKILSFSFCPVNQAAVTSWSGYLNAGDTVRPMNNGGPVSPNPTYGLFWAERL